MIRLEPPGGMGRRALEALALLLAIAYGSHMIFEWFRPLIPTVIVLMVLAGMYTAVFGRRR